MVTRRPRGAYKVGLARRTRIVEAAAQRFAAEGYHQVSMAQIAQDAGISDSGLLHHFPSKHHLLLAVVEFRMQSGDDRWAAIPIDIGGVETLREMVDATAWHVSQPGLIELFVITASEASEPSSPAHELYSRQYEAVVEEIAQRFRSGVAAGELVPDLDCAATARECIAVSDGLQLQWVLTRGRLDLVGGVRRHADRLARTITVDGRGLDS
ncbi:TetR/AcrR family transcriptional regulator [Streptomyces shenzhenensis]|uniref:TetR family transcriptional regulator n=1 Tax=Streptomyces shenzhenensis TaxID=943815 RepID=A0A3M0IDM7_9ACTN|nr:TetR/AcrR family transcriptional regulator [Streptomyces shenzhenensis]RMB84903.1 TetR family transcriptional regulator [Streptomyces shenzhenensis]